MIMIPIAQRLIFAVNKHLNQQKIKYHAFEHNKILIKYLIERRGQSSSQRKKGVIINK